MLGRAGAVDPKTPRTVWIGSTHGVFKSEDGGLSRKASRGVEPDDSVGAAARIHERIRNRRHDFCHQNAWRIVNRFGVIAFEKLSVENMTCRPKANPDPNNEGQFLPNGASAKAGLNKSIVDAARSQLRSTLVSKAESAGRETLAVNTAYTSQDCSGCGYRPDGLGGRTKKKLSERWHLCPMCSLSVDRDTNAVVNILDLLHN